MEVYFSRMMKRSKKFNPSYNKRYHKYLHMKKIIDEQRMLVGDIPDE